MATNNNAETNNAVDVLLTQEDILAFFLSKSGEVKNSELVAHFRWALKTGRHGATNRQQFPRFINHLATVAVDDNGAKTLTLKKRFRRQDDGAAISPEDSGGDVINRDTVTKLAESHSADKDEETAVLVEDNKVTTVSKQDDMNESEKHANVEEDEDAATKTVSVSNDDDVQDECLSENEQQSEHVDKCSSAKNEERRQTTNEETHGANVGPVDLSCTARTNEERDQGKSSDSEGRQPELMETGNDLVDDDSARVQETPGNHVPPPVIIVVEDQKQTDEVDAHRVRQLAQRLDEAANKRTSTAIMRTNKQVLAEPGRPPTGTGTGSGRPSSTLNYDFTMNESQREWTLRSSYSDYQALAKLLSRHHGNPFHFIYLFHSSRS